MNQTKKVQKKPPVNKFYTPAHSSSINAHDSPDIPIEESVGVQKSCNPIKIINQEDTHQLAPSLAKIENQSKERGYSSIESSEQIGKKV